MEKYETITLREDEAAYPKRLLTLKDPPKLLYVAGKIPDADRKAVAIIGSRGCSFYGKQMAEWFGSALAREGVVIISGMATGIDGIGQRAALEAGGCSVGVLGCGLDVCYPAANRDLYQALARRGCLISEYPPGTKPEAWHFPRRNRLISAMADLVLVIEAREKSGTLITVEYALEQGKDVFALPGRVSDPLSAGCNRLLEQGAGMALTPEHILFALYGQSPKRGDSRSSERQKERYDGLSDEEKNVLRHLDANGTTMAQLLQRLDRDVSLHDVMRVLIGLQTKQIVRQDAGRYYDVGKGKEFI